MFGGWAIDHGCVVLGVGHAGRGELGQHRLHGGAGLRRQPAAKPRHPIDVLGAQAQPAASGAVDVGESAVRVKVGGEPLGEFGKLVGAVRGGQLGQMGFGFLAGIPVDAAGQPVHELAQHSHMAATDGALALSGRGAGQQRRQRLTGDGAARPQIGSFGHSSGRLGAADAQPVGQHV
jgi:hypothetical protein